MKQCTNPKCLQFNPNDAAPECPYCRTPYSTPRGFRKNTAQVQTDLNTGSGAAPGRTPVNVKKIGLFAGLAAGAVALAAVIFLLVSSLFGTTALGAAAENSIDSLADQLSGQSNLSAYLGGTSPFSARSDVHILVGIQTPDVFLSLDTNYAGSKKLMTGTVELGAPHEDFQISADFHANRKEVRIYAPDLVNDIYGFTYRDFEKKYDKSQLRKFLDLPLSEELTLAPFRGFDLKEYLQEQGGVSWEEFEDSLDIEKYDTRQLTLGNRTEECTVYRVQWDAKKAERMLKTITRNTLGFLPDVIPELATKLAPDVRFYVDSEDNLVGVDFTFLNSIYTFLLEGENNPWELATLQIVTAGAEPMHFSGGVISDAEGVRIELKAQNQTVYAIYYTNSTGAYSIVSPNGELSNGVFLSDSTGFHLESNFHNFSYVISVSELDRLPGKTEENYVDLMDLSISEFGRLTTELCNSLEITLEDLIGNLGALFGG